MKNSKNLEILKEKLKKEIVINGDYEFLMLIKEIKDHIKIDTGVGPVLYSEKAKTLNQSDRILLFLVGLSAGKYLEALSRDFSTRDEIASKTFVRPQVARSRITELLRRNIIINLGGGKGKPARYKVTDYGIQFFRRRILKKLSDGNGRKNSKRDR